MRPVLNAAAAVYGALTRFRNRLYDRSFLESEAVSLPVISVGNLTMGGNGKTPLCIALARAAQALKRRPVILSRGYGGLERGPYQVKASDDWKKVGDEPLMMARFHGLSVVVARERVRGAEFICREDLGDLIILDDGFQHRALSRVLDIVCQDVSSERSRREFVEGRLVPAGRFREERAAAFRRTGLLVLSYRGLESPAELDELYQVVPPGVPVLEAGIRASGVFSLSGGQRHEPGRVSAFCGLANPEGFFSTLEALGFSVVASRSLGDHRAADAALLSGLRREAPGLSIVCTEKDAVKLNLSDAADVFVLRIETAEPQSRQPDGSLRPEFWAGSVGL